METLCYRKRTVLFLLLLMPIDNTNLKFIFVRKGPVSKMFRVLKFIYSFRKLQFLRVGSELLRKKKELAVLLP